MKRREPPQPRGRRGSELPAHLARGPLVRRMRTEAEDAERFAAWVEACTKWSVQAGLGERGWIDLLPSLAERTETEARDGYMPPGQSLVRAYLMHGRPKVRR